MAGIEGQESTNNYNLNAFVPLSVKRFPIVSSSFVALAQRLNQLLEHKKNVPGLFFPTCAYCLYFLKLAIFQIVIFQFVLFFKHKNTVKYPRRYEKKRNWILVFHLTVKKGSKENLVQNLESYWASFSKLNSTKRGDGWLAGSFAAQAAFALMVLGWCSFCSTLFLNNERSYDLSSNWYFNSVHLFYNGKWGLGSRFRVYRV